MDCRRLVWYVFAFFNRGKPFDFFLVQLQENRLEIGGNLNRFVAHSQCGTGIRGLAPLPSLHVADPYLLRVDARNTASARRGATCA